MNSTIQKSDFVERKALKMNISTASLTNTFFRFHSMKVERKASKIDVSTAFLVSTFSFSQHERSIRSNQNEIQFEWTAIQSLRTVSLNRNKFLKQTKVTFAKWISIKLDRSHAWHIFANFLYMWPLWRTKFEDRSFSMLHFHDNLWNIAAAQKISIRSRFEG